MNRRDFLKRFPIAAALPFLPVIPALPEPPKLTKFTPSGIEIVARGLNKYLAELEAQGVDFSFASSLEALTKGMEMFSLQGKFGQLADSFRTMVEEDRRENGRSNHSNGQR